MTAFVNLTRLTNALKKVGATVEIIEIDKTHNYGRGVARLNNRVLEFTYQPGFPDRSKATVPIIVVPSPHTDIMTDCFCDTFFDTIKSAVAYITGN